MCELKKYYLGGLVHLYRHDRKEERKKNHTILISTWMGLNIFNVMLLLSHFRVSLCTSFLLSSTLSPSLPLSMSVRWFMALFKRRPHVSPDAAICFNPASFFHSPHSEANEEPTKINPWLTLARQSVFCSSTRGWWWGFTHAPLTKCWAAPALFRCCWEHASDIEKWHATRMPLIMFRGKVGEMANVTRPSYQPNFIRGIHVWAGKSCLLPPTSLYCKQPLHGERIQASSGSKLIWISTPTILLYQCLSQTLWHNCKIRHAFLFPNTTLRLQRNSLHFLDDIFFSNLPFVTLKISSYRFSCELKQLFD